jgi:hypothetical protein
LTFQQASLAVTPYMPSTKQLRLNDTAQIRQGLTGFLGKKINIVLADKRVIVGDLREVNASGIDMVNMRGKKTHYPFELLYEVYFDVIV